MSLDDIISALLEAKEHCVPGNTNVKVWHSNDLDLSAKDTLEGNVCYIDYDNSGVNIYYS